MNYKSKFDRATRALRISIANCGKMLEQIGVNAIRRIGLSAGVALILLTVSAFEVTAQLVDQRVVHAFLSTDEKGHPLTTFSAATSNIYLMWKSEQMQPGDEIRIVWIAEDVEGGGGQESTIGERTINVRKPAEDGSCFVARPKDRLWPVGKYRAEIYVGKRVVSVLRFSIKSAGGAAAPTSTSP